MKTAVNIAMIGPTNAGKTTTAARLCQLFNLRHLSTGKLLRESLEQQTALGLMTRKYMERGELVPDEIINSLLEETVRKTPSDQGLLLDGFPSTVYQALFLEGLLLDTKRTLDTVVLMHIPDAVVFKRASRRVPVRLDDRPGILRRRLRVFRRTTGPVLEFYRRGQKLAFMDASGTIEAVAAAVAGVLYRIQKGDYTPSLSEGEERTLQDILAEPIWQKVSSAQAGHDFVILGAPGCGKGTHATFLSKYLGVPHVPTGNLFRENLKNDTTLGKIARSYIDHGKLVPDDITDAMVRERLNHDDLREGFIMDGYPRTLPQARTLDDILGDICRQLTAAVYLNVPDDLIVERTAGRRWCPKCQKSYHIEFNKPKEAGICDQDGTTLIQREDDAPETVRARLRIFHGQTMPVVDFYRQAGMIVEVSGDGAVAEVQESLAALMDPFRRNT